MKKIGRREIIVHPRREAIISLPSAGTPEIRNPKSDILLQQVFQQRPQERLPRARIKK